MVLGLIGYSGRGMLPARLCPLMLDEGSRFRLDALLLRVGLMDIPSLKDCIRRRASRLVSVFRPPPTCMASFRGQVVRLWDGVIVAVVFIVV